MRRTPKSKPPPQPCVEGFDCPLGAVTGAEDTHFATDASMTVNFSRPVLEGENAVLKHRELLGATDSKKAAPGTIRAQWGTDIERNAGHGSDSLDNAKQEIAFFFSGAELAALGVK